MSAISENNRKKLLKAAAELFADKGFDAVSTRDLCSKAEVNVAAISYYFGGKEGLYLEVFKEHAQILVDNLDRPLSFHQGRVTSAKDLEGILRDLIVSFINIRLRQPEVAIVLQRQTMDKIPGVREAFQTIMEPAGIKLTQFFQDLQTAHIIRADLNIKSFITILVESIWGYFSMQERGGSLLKDAYRLPEDQDQFVDFLTQIYIRGISA